MSAGATPPHAGRGSIDSEQAEPYSVDPRIAPGLPRPEGWRVRAPDGSAAYDKFGPNDTDWTPVGTAAAGGPGFGTGVAGPTATGAAGVALTARRSDQTAAAYRSDLPLATTWFIDPVAGSDAAANPGTTNATALKTFAELKRRWWGAELQANTTVTVLGNVPAADANVFNTGFKPDVAITLIGSLGVTTGFGGRVVDNTLYTGSVTGYVAGSATPAADDIELTDTAIPVSFTASGLMAPGVIFRRTVTATRHWFAAKDLGAKTIRITTPMANGPPKSFAANPLTVGNAYSAFQMWTMPTQTFGFADTLHMFVDSLLAIPASGTDFQGGGPRGYAPIRSRVWIQNPASFTIGSASTNCVVSATQDTFVECTVNKPPNFGGMFIGTGATRFIFFGVSGFGGTVIFQGCRMEINDWTYITVEAAVGFFDVAGAPCINIIGSGVMSVTNPTGVGAFSGKGNNNKLLVVSIGGRLYFGQSIPIPIFNAASSSDPSPIQIGSISYAVAALPTVAETILSPLLQFPNGLSSTTPANAAVSVAMTNAPAGSPAAPARYIKIPDGAGGFYTFPSLT